MKSVSIVHSTMVYSCPYVQPYIYSATTCSVRVTFSFFLSWRTARSREKHATHLIESSLGLCIYSTFLASNVSYCAYYEDLVHINTHIYSSVFGSLLAMLYSFVYDDHVPLIRKAKARARESMHTHLCNSLSSDREQVSQ